LGSSEGFLERVFFINMKVRGQMEICPFLLDVSVDKLNRGKL